jgi:hypothetical protein
MSHEIPAPGGAPQVETTAGTPDGTTAAPPDRLALEFADLRAQLRDQVARLRALGRDVALAVAARVDADAAIAESTLSALELAPQPRRRRAQVRRLERLMKRLSAVELEPAKGRRRDLKEVARSVRRITTALTEPIEG